MYSDTAPLSLLTLKSESDLIQQTPSGSHVPLVRKFWQQQIEKDVQV